MPQLKSDITKARFSSGNISERIPVAKGLQPDSLRYKKIILHRQIWKENSYPAAIIILSNTSCQYSLTAPQIAMATAKTAVHTVNILTLLYLSAANPKITPTMVKTAMKLGPARI